MRKLKLKGSYTIEAAIYIPFILFLMLQSLKISIDYWQASRERVRCESLQELDTVREFYVYQILEEVGEEIEDGAN